MSLLKPTEKNSGFEWKQAISKQSKVAMERDKIKSISTISFQIREPLSTVPFEWNIRYVSSLKNKPVDQNNEKEKILQPEEHPMLGLTPPKFNPFGADLDEDMRIGSLFGTHHVIFNKFNVIENHLLLITQNYERQMELVNEKDFRAMSFVVCNFDSLVFMNGRLNSGASQPHKHFQVLPLGCFDEGKSRFPTQPLFSAHSPQALGELFKIPLFQFDHVCVSLSPKLFNSINPEIELMQLFEKMVNFVALNPLEGFNFFMTAHEMFLVPRKKELFEKCGASFSINSVGFLGSILLKFQEDLDLFQSGKILPLEVLHQITRKN